MKEMPAGAFKAQCLAVMDAVSETGEPIVITKHGKPVVKLIPAEKAADDIFGYMAGKVKIVGDIVGPVTPAGDWKNHDWDSNDGKRNNRKSNNGKRK